MERKKDITKLIRDNHRKLDERPSSKAWQKLEKRLDRKTGARRLLLLSNPFIRAAAILVLVITAVLAGLFLPAQFDRGQPVSGVGNDPAPRVIEELPASSNSVEEAASMEAFRRKHLDQLSDPVAEGDDDKRLVVQSGEKAGSRRDNSAEMRERGNGS